MTEDELYELLLRTGAAGDSKRYGGQPSMIERIARRQARAVRAALAAKLDGVTPTG